MSEPEDVILEGAHAATRWIGLRWKRRRPDAPEVRLRDVRRRLELWVGAVNAGTPRIVVANPPARPSWIGRVAMRTPSHLVDLRAHAGTDGLRIRLPRVLPAPLGAEPVIAHFRLLAIQQAARIERGTASLLHTAPTVLVRDLFLVREAYAVDRALHAALPGLRRLLRDAQRVALAERPAAKRLTAQECAVEDLIADVLNATDSIDGAIASTPADSMHWATEMAGRIATRAGNYRGMRAVAYWGQTVPPPARRDGLSQDMPDEDARPTRPQRVHHLTRSPTPREAPPDEDDDAMGMWMIQLDDPQEHAEDPKGLQRPTDRDDSADPGELADSLSELPEVRVVAARTPTTEVLIGDEPPPHVPLRMPAFTDVGNVVRYPEWDYRRQAYTPAGSVVREVVALEGNPAWSEQVRTRLRSELAQIRRRFERLRPQRVRRGRLRDGDEVDLSAFLTDYADQRAGCAPDDRLYASQRAERRDLVIQLLVDTSSSTDSWVGEGKRVIDVEKEALLLVCEALDALGDQFAVLAFSGEGPERVSVSLIKSFAAPHGGATALRIAALEPAGYTRTGAAIRHATAALAGQHARHRLLLVLSDGKPNDVDLYEGRYGIEDTRQAVAEARGQGVHLFCITVDREAPDYMPHVFGVGSYAVLGNAARLPEVMLEVVRRLVAD